MRIITPYNIKKYCECPKRSNYTWDARPIPFSTEGAIISNVIKTAHLYFAQKGKPAIWRRFSLWIDKFLKQAISDSLSKQHYKEAKNILTRIHIWWREYYIDKYEIPCLINIPILLDIGQNHKYVDNIPMVGLSDKAVIFDFEEIDTYSNALSSIKLYNDISVQARLWGFVRGAEAIPAEYVRIYIAPQTIKAVKISISNETIEKATRVIQHVLNGICNNIFYPSFSEQCKACPFKAKCSF